MFSTYVVVDHRKSNLVKDLGRVHGTPTKKLHPSEHLLGKYLDLPLPKNKILASYIWVDGTGENVRSKTGTLDFIPEVPKDKFTLLMEGMEERAMAEAVKDLTFSEYEKYKAPYFCPRNLENIYKVQCRLRVTRNKHCFDENLKDLPIWTYDGSGTGQAPRSNSDLYLFPRAIYKDPFRRGNNILVMCDTFNRKLEPTATNHRVSCAEADQKCKEEQPWFGFEQEFLFMNCFDLRPLGWPKQGFPLRSSHYFCGIGADKIFGRDLMHAHYRCCLYAGIPLCGTNAEMGPSQWEYQVGPSVGVNAGDDLWVSRYILNCLAQEYGVVLEMDPKPLPDWTGSGAHVNFSTMAMREENGIVEIEKAIKKLSNTHMEHIQVYDPHQGRDNARRLTGQHETGSLNDFTTGIAERFCSIRIPREVSILKKGYFEDRRPASNCDPYCVVNALLRTCILNE